MAGRLMLYLQDELMVRHFKAASEVIEYWSVLFHELQYGGSLKRDLVKQPSLRSSCVLSDEYYY